MSDNRSRHDRLAVRLSLIISRLMAGESLSLKTLSDEFGGKRLVRTVLIFTESSDQLSRATDRVPGLPASPGYVQ
ncbi:transcriptional regulator [Escherichia coli]|nr:transcriptional regulator [Escherichia coli]